jgi:hypothetical protein
VRADQSRLAAGLLIGKCGRTLLAYKARFGHAVPKDNEAWLFDEFYTYGPVGR